MQNCDMLSKTGTFDKKDAGSLVENNLVVAASVAVEESFHRYLLEALNLGEDWRHNALRAVVAFVVYNVIKYVTLLARDEEGWTKTRRFGAWVCEKLFGV
jgi:hypothetical protein